MIVYVMEDLLKLLKLFGDGIFLNWTYAMGSFRIRERDAL